MSEDKKNIQTASEAKAKKAKKKGGLKNFLKSRKARHGSMSIVITAIVIAIVIVINVICGLLVDRFPDSKIDFTANNNFALQEDTIDYVSHLNKNVTLYVLTSEADFESQGGYFMQAKTLLEKMESNSNGKIKIEYVDLTTNPTFTAKYSDIDWTETSGNYLILVECGNNHKMLTLTDCFTYDQEYYSYYGQYMFTSTTVEQAVVTAMLNVTTDERVLVDIVTGNNEQEYTGIKTLLEKNAYDVNEISLITQGIDENAKFLIIYAPAVDFDEKSIDAISKWLDNDGKYGRTLVYIPTTNHVDTPNLDALIADWGMEVNDGIVFETNPDYLVTGTTEFAFITDYTEHYVDGLKNAKIPVVVTDAKNILIKDETMAHALLNTSSDTGVYPYDADENWDYKDAMTGEPLVVGAEATKTSSENVTSNVIVFGSYMMFNEQIMSFNSYNNSAYLMNIFNTIADKDDAGITIESKSLESTELGVTDVSTTAIALIVFIFVIPIAVLLTGIILWIRRRNK